MEMQNLRDQRESTCFILHMCDLNEFLCEQKFLCVQLRTAQLGLKNCKQRRRSIYCTEARSVDHLVFLHDEACRSWASFIVKSSFRTTENQLNL